MMYGWIIAVIVVVILFVAFNKGGIFKRKPNSTENNRTPKTPLETLKNRYAKGEIDEEEFEKRKKELEKAG